MPFGLKKYIYIEQRCLKYYLIAYEANYVNKIQLEGS